MGGEWVSSGLMIDPRRPEVGMGQDSEGGPASLAVVDLVAAARQAVAGHQPVMVAEFDSYVLSVVRVSEGLGRHRHDDADEPLIVLEGAVEVEADGQLLRLGPGQLCDPSWSGPTSPSGRGGGAVVVRAGAGRMRWSSCELAAQYSAQAS
jgi:hypothetical protein